MFTTQPILFKGTFPCKNKKWISLFEQAGFKVHGFVQQSRQSCII